MTKQARGDETALRVLEAALTCAAESGLHEIKVQELSARSGVSVGSIYHHFGSREGVVFALYRRCLSAMLDAIAASVSKHRDAERGVRALVTSYLRWVERHQDEARVIYAFGETELVRTRGPEIAALAAEVVGPVAEWLAPHVGSGRVLGLGPGLLEIVLVGPAAEASRRILAGAVDCSFDDAVRVLPEVTWRAVAGRPARRRGQRVGTAT